MNTNIIYDFEVNQSTYPDYKINQTVLNWLQSNLASLTDDNSKKLFSKVNLGFNEDTLRNFNNKAVCDVYLQDTQYRNDFDFNTPSTVNTVVVVSLRGNANNTYNKALELSDYIIQEFIENISFRELDRVVSQTRITNSTININRNTKILTTHVVFELEHVLI